MSGYATQRGYLERPGCRLYYEVTGTGPAVVFAHGLGSNHMTWWQQVPHFAPRYTCVTFSHRGYPPGSEIPGGPDPQHYGSDLAALIDALKLVDVRLVAQSMGGVSALEYMFSFDHRCRALVLTSTCGTIQKAAIPLPDPQRLANWQRDAAQARADMQRRDIAPPAGNRMAREQPELHFLYKQIANASAAFDREALRAQCGDLDPLAGVDAQHRNADALHYRRRGHDLSGVSVRRTGCLDAERARRAGRGCRPLGVLSTCCAIQYAGRSIFCGGRRCVTGCGPCGSAECKPDEKEARSTSGPRTEG